MTILPTHCTCGSPMLFEAGWPDSVCAQGLNCEDIGFGLVPIRPDWDEWGIYLAQSVAIRADCRRARHGAVILSADHRVVSVGYNGYPAGVKGCIDGGCPRGSVPPSQLPHRAPYHEGIGLCSALHAESNALLYADRASVKGGTMYITGESCHGCQVLISGSGLVRSVWPGGEWNIG